MLRLQRAFLLVLAVIALSPGVSQADIVARVVTVHEGDRLTIRHDSRNEEIYIKDIDCPELKQPYGKQAKHATSAYVANREVIVRKFLRDKQGRLFAEVVLQDGRIVGRELLKEGLAWWRRSPPGDPNLEVLEELAKASGIGLWSDPNPVPPWKWNQKAKVTR